MTDQHPGQQPPNPQRPYASSQQQPVSGGAASWNYEPSGAPQSAPPQNGWSPAPRVGLIPLRPLTFGEIFGSTFKLLRTNAGISIGAALVVQGIVAVVAAGLPIIVAVWAQNRISMASGRDAELLSAALPGWLLLSVIPGVILSLLGAALLQVIIVQVTAKGVLNRKARLGETLRTGWSRLWPILGYFGLALAAMVIVLLVFGLLVGLGVWLGSGEQVLGVLLVVLVGVLLALGFLVAAIWVATKLTFAMPAIVLENKGPIAAIRRSWRLTSGYFWRTFGILLLLQLIVQAMSQVVGGVLGFIMGIVPSFLVPTGEVAEGQEGGLIALIIVLVILTVLLSVLISAIGQVLVTGNAAIMYTDLRMRKEGLNIHLQSAAEAYAEGREPAQDPWLAPDLGPLPTPAPSAPPAQPPAGYPQPGYPGPSASGSAPGPYAPGQYGQGQYAQGQYGPGQRQYGQGQYGSAWTQQNDPSIPVSPYGPDADSARPGEQAPGNAGDTGVDDSAPEGPETGRDRR